MITCFRVKELVAQNTEKYLWNQTKN